MDCEIAQVPEESLRLRSFSTSGTIWELAHRFCEYVLSCFCGTQKSTTSIMRSNLEAFPIASSNWVGLPMAIEANRLTIDVAAMARVAAHRRLPRRDRGLGHDRPRHGRSHRRGYRCLAGLGLSLGQQQAVKEQTNGNTTKMLEMLETQGKMFARRVQPRVPEDPKPDDGL